MLLANSVWGISILLAVVLVSYIFFIKGSRFSNKIKYVAFVFLLISSIVVVCDYFKYKKEFTSNSVDSPTTFSEFITKIENSDKHIAKFKCQYPVIIGNVSYSIYYLYRNYNIQEVIRRQDSNKVKDSSVGSLDLKKRVKNVVLIMSESSSSRFYSVYGYRNYNTNPRLAYLNGRGDISICSKVHSPSNITRTSVPLNLSFASPKSFYDLYTYKSIVNLAHDAGYKTIWLATQNSGGLSGWGNTYEYISRSSDYLVSPDITNENFGLVVEDDNLTVPLLKKSIDLTKGEYRFIVLHWVGNHAPYHLRYDSVDSQKYPQYPDYEKSILKSDRLVEAVINILKNLGEEYFLVFTADHGEIPYDEGAGKEHGLTYGGYGQYEIPFIISSSIYSDRCHVLDTYRSSNGYFSGLFTKFIILQKVGYNVDLDKIKVMKNPDLILHSDGNVYTYEDLPVRNN